MIFVMTIQTSLTFRKLRKKGLICTITYRYNRSSHNLKEMGTTYFSYNFKLKKMCMFMHVSCMEFLDCRDNKHDIIRQKKTMYMYNMCQSDTNRDYKAKYVIGIDHMVLDKCLSFNRTFNSKRIIERKKKNNISRTKYSFKEYQGEKVDIFSKKFERRLFDIPI